MSETIPSDLIPVPKAADLIGVTRQSMNRWIRQRRLPAWGIVGRLRVSRADVLGLIQRVEPDDPERPLTRREVEERDAETDRLLRAAGIRK